MKRTASIAMASPAKPRRLGVYSRTLERGAIGASISGKSREGRYLRAFEAKILAQMGPETTFLTKITASRLAKVALRLELFDEKIVSGEGLTDHDGRVYNALHNSFRLLVRELGLKATLSPAGGALRSLRDYTRRQGR